MILCEKPLSLDGPQGEEMVRVIEAAGVPNTVWYNYRRIPAVSLAKQLIDTGKLGRIFHYRANFLQDWTISADLPQGGAGLWRLDAKAAGSGVTGDLLAHCIDTAIWLNGRIMEVTAMTETFIKERKHTGTGKVEEVKIDDACAFLARFENGSLAIFESTRYARGHKALYTLEINGENASIAWDLHDLHRLKYFDYKDEAHRARLASVHVTDGDQPYMKNWWVPGLAIGYAESFVHQVADFVKAVGEGQAVPSHLPRCAGDAVRLRRRAGVGADAGVEDGDQLREEVSSTRARRWAGAGSASCAASSPPGVGTRGRVRSLPPPLASIRFASGRPPVKRLPNSRGPLRTGRRPSYRNS